MASTIRARLAGELQIYFTNFLFDGEDGDIISGLERPECLRPFQREKLLAIRDNLIGSVRGFWASLIFTRNAGFGQSCALTLSGVSYRMVKDIVGSEAVQ